MSNVCSRHAINGCVARGPTREVLDEINRRRLEAENERLRTALRGIEDVVKIALAEKPLTPLPAK